jgi:glycogen debranching enzyme
MTAHPSYGLRLNSNGASFTVYSEGASAIQLCLFDQAGKEERVALKRSGALHSVDVTGIGAGQCYGLRAHGPYSPGEGQHFDASKLLLDPYARAISGSFHYVPKLSQHGADTASLVPKAIAQLDMPDLPLRSVRPPKLIYELNVRGFTMLHPDVPPAKRGTIAALAEPAVISHFKKLGVDCVELMPIAAWIDERHLVNLGLRNAWGYNPVCFFAIEPRLAPSGLAELRDTVAKLHAEGISVVLDVVFNHTGESDASGPTLSFRGLDNRSYYRLFHGGYVNDAGTGNIMALDRPHTVQLVVDAMRHWVLQAGVDGFRFDLATVMGRREDGFAAKAPLLEAIDADPVLSSRLLIAEPWDIGPGGYQLGHFPNDWFEWNDKFRDDVRRFWRGDPWSANAMATRLAGSSDVFGAKGRPSRSINFIAAHDGFTLHDLLHFTQKQNLANGENNRDGKADEVTCTNANAAALFTSLLFSRGTPMLCAGDEFGRTQNGNNNAYAQDNETTWLNWVNRDQALEAIFADIVALRRMLEDAFADQFLRAEDVVWLDGEGQTFDWQKSDARVLIMCIKSARTILSFAVNGGPHDVPFPAITRQAQSWRCLLGNADMLRAKSFSVFVSP